MKQDEQQKGGGGRGNNIQGNTNKEQHDKGNIENDIAFFIFISVPLSEFIDTQFREQNHCELAEIYNSSGVFASEAITSTGKTREM